MGKGKVTQACKVCFDTNYNTINIIFKQNMDNHYKSANIRSENGQRVSHHDMNIEYKGYNLDTHGLPIIN